MIAGVAFHRQTATQVAAFNKDCRLVNEGLVNLTGMPN